ncbi:glucose-1-phosphate thymidylyltransferase RfbA [Actinokineospora sp. NBRC 105648]|uniref:glucose-1-phosphate thymidylyltransferase RfbA n=1 Tax=Actinokineospora sp. NBRC 105648 TaxID=3032206 RepID=UPI0024A189DC|nr:glucose-1-phosphate thymidylyltransferase RfbA [Actinokineospora sp. NBRC 105648]GLZ36619.1 glucose-1-phosphate thymidylyltransferase [Actinokineospora sp. NBRC 105648]
MKGIVLAGGSGTRLHPTTLAVSKQLIPVYDKPTVYYPISVLMLTGIDDILIISSPEDLPQFRRLLGDGSDLGVRFSYAEQERPNGLAEALIIGASHIGDDTVALVLGDNVFHGPGLSPLLQRNARDVDGCVLFGYQVSDPERYGVGEVDDSGRLLSIEEKPAVPRSNQAITGLYFYSSDVVDIAKNIQPSARGELEITDVNRRYLAEGRATLVELRRGYTWLDTGTPQALLTASQFVGILESRQRVRIACLEEIALRMGFIDAEACHRLGERLGKSDYGQYVMEVARSWRPRVPVTAE